MSAGTPGERVRTLLLTEDNLLRSGRRERRGPAAPPRPGE
jgi:hypothetical protein